MVHAYYDFQHVELSNVGSGKKKVIKPPGGGSNIVFGDDVDTRSPTVGNGARSRQPASSRVLGDSCCSSDTASSNGSSPPSTPVKPVSPVPDDVVDKKAMRTSSNGISVAAAAAKRVPPGGYSTRLW